MNKPLLHLDRLSQADLGKFAVLLSQTLTTSQRARLNVTIPDIMAEIGAFDVPKDKPYHSQPVGIGSNSNALPAGQKAREVTAIDIESFTALIQAQKKIQAIKECRAICGVSLKDAKDFIDALCVKIGYVPKTY